MRELLQSFGFCTDAETTGYVGELLDSFLFRSQVTNNYPSTGMPQSISSTSATAVAPVSLSPTNAPMQMQSALQRQQPPVPSLSPSSSATSSPFTSLQQPVSVSGVPAAYGVRFIVDLMSLVLFFIFVSCATGLATAQNVDRCRRRRCTHASGGLWSRAGTNQSVYAGLWVSVCEC